MNPRYSFSILTVFVVVAVLLAACGGGTSAAPAIAATPFAIQAAVHPPDVSPTFVPSRIPASPTIEATPFPTSTPEWNVHSPVLDWGRIGGSDKPQNKVLPDHQNLWTQLAEGLIFSGRPPCDIPGNCAVFTAQTSSGREFLVVRAGDLKPVYFPLTSDGNTSWSGLDKKTGLGQGDWTYSLGHGDQVAVLTGISSSELGKGNLVSTTDSKDAISCLALVEADGRVTALLALYTGSSNDNIARWIVRDADSALGVHMPDIAGKQLVATESGPDLTFVAYYDVDQATGQILFEKSPTLDGKTVGMWKRMPDGSWQALADMKNVPTITPPPPEPTATSTKVAVKSPPAVKPSTTPVQQTEVITGSVITTGTVETAPPPVAPGECAQIPDGARSRFRNAPPDMEYGAYVSYAAGERGISEDVTYVYGRVTGRDPKAGTMTVFYGGRMNLSVTYQVDGLKFEFISQERGGNIDGVGQTCLGNIRADGESPDGIGDTVRIGVRGYIGGEIFRIRIKNHPKDSLPDVQALLNAGAGGVIVILASQ